MVFSAPTQFSKFWGGGIGGGEGSEEGFSEGFLEGGLLLTYCSEKGF